ncbi:MAG TPA: (Fe-S)-binding protein [Nitrospirae bacterium]|nr:anaerobic glycerol-3-phosphate dehydrogenase subunit C [bacterium BMS3Abin06]HDH11024.1 (Fe-S)-binding protein [Nitrospirota bacterium]HDZ01308.1 (Fe-S)-binding protein [Nitrospirota bacterium]
MNEAYYFKELSKCVRCGTCKSICPTYLSTLNETMGARGRVAMLGQLGMKRLAPTGGLAEKIFSCMLCGACKKLCPAGINIPEIIYQGRNVLKNSYSKGRLLRSALKLSMSRLDNIFAIMRACQKVFYRPLYKAGLFGYVPEITSRPFRKTMQVYKNIKKTGRIALFAGCSVNYIYPDLGNALSGILLSKGYEVVVFKGELCCGAPMRAMGLEQEASTLAEKNIELFNKVRAEAIISLCPTCTMVIREQYPVLTGNTIMNIMDVNEFFIEYDITAGLEINPAVVTYHDPCHLNYGLGIKDKPRHILKNIKGIEFVGMKHADECCGFAGLFSRHFKKISSDIGRRKIDNILNTSAETVVTSCPGCMMQLESLKRETKSNFDIKHMVEIVDEAMHG